MEDTQVNFVLIVFVTFIATLLASGFVYFFRYFIIVQIGHSLIEKVVIRFRRLEILVAHGKLDSVKRRKVTQKLLGFHNSLERFGEPFNWTRLR